MNETHLFNRIPEYHQIILDLSRGNLKADFSLKNRRSKLAYSLEDILFDENNDELSYFVLFMDSLNSSNYVKFLLDLNNFEKALRKYKTSLSNSCKSACKMASSTNRCDCHLVQRKAIADDALSIFSKYISKDATYSVNVSDQIIHEIIANICPENEDSHIDLKCFDAGKQFVFDLIQKEYHSIYLLSDYHCKYLMNILENQSLSLPDLLYDDIAVVYLLEYLEQEKCSDLMKFWIQAENFSRNVSSLEYSNDLHLNIDVMFKQWQSDAVIIYDNFISLQAKNSLGFDLLVRRQVELNISQHIDNQSEDIEYLVNSYSNVFYLPMLIVFNILDKIYFKKFLASILYQKYISEIKINSKQSNTQLIKKSSSVPKKTSLPIKNSNINNLNSNNDLWSRPNATSMQFGKIDSTGRFISHFRSDEDAWSLDDTDSNMDCLSKQNRNSHNGLIEKIINLLPLNNPKHTAEELEMAEKMAAMLVQDVVNQNYIS